MSVNVKRAAAPIEKLTTNDECGAWAEVVAHEMGRGSHRVSIHNASKKSYGFFTIEQLRDLAADLVEVAEILEAETI